MPGSLQPRHPLPPRYIAVPFVGGGTVLPIPTPSLIATTVSGSQINLVVTYSGPPGAVSYSFEKASSVNGPFMPLASGSSSTFNDTGLVPSTTYFYRARVQVNDGRFSDYSTVKSATTLASAPQPPASITATDIDSVSASITWASSPGATSYNLYRNGTNLGAKTSPFTDTGLTPSTFYSYTVTAVNAAGESAQSSPSSITTAASSTPTGRKFNGGHYAGASTTIFRAQTISRIQNELDALKPYQRVLGYMAFMSWAALEPVKGETDVTATYPRGYATGAALIRSIYDYLTNTSLFGTPRRLVVKLQVGGYTQTHPGSTDYSIIPQYVQTDSAYGNAGYRVSGTVTNVPGQHGWWGGDGNGNTYAACLHRAVVSARINQLASVMGSYFDSLPYFEGWNFDENSFTIGTSSSNGNPDWSPTAFANNTLSYLQACAAAWPTTSVMYENTYAGNPTASQDVAAQIAANKIDFSVTDVMGQSYVDAHGGQPLSWGAEIYIGQTGGGTRAAVDYQGQGYGFFPEIQGTDMGAFGQFGNNGVWGYPKEDILQDLIQTLGAHKAFWGVLLPPRSNWGTHTNADGSTTPTLRANSTWDFLGPFLNDPANALPNATVRPKNY